MPVHVLDGIPVLSSGRLRKAPGQKAEVRVFDLYKLEKFTGCISCFGCKLAPNEGKCICKDGLASGLEAIRNADGLIIGTPEAFVGNTKQFIAGNTLQVKDYSRFNWTMFDPEAKKERHEKVFPQEWKNVFALGAEMVTKPW